MATQVTLPGIGPVDKKYAYAGAAAVAGIIGYAWWQRVPEDADAQPADPITAGEAVGLTDDTVLPAGGTGNAGGSYDLTDPAVIDTNAEWTKECVSQLAAVGFEPLTVSRALGKYLGRQPVTEAEAEIIRTATAFVGPPPEGGPYPIIPTSSGGGSNPPPPAGSAWKGPARRKATWPGKGRGVNANTHVNPNLSTWDQVVGYYYENLPPYSGTGTTRATIATALQKFNGNKAMKPGMRVYLKATLP